MTFLKAEWRKLILANYVIDKALLKDYIPNKTELDLLQGKCYVSLVGFMFLNTKILGVKIPFHSDFEEVNLRFYVKFKYNNEWKRGVVFIKEIVPKRAITFFANILYNENYQTLPMQHNWEMENDAQLINYKWKYRNKWHYLSLNSKTDLLDFQPGSEEEFITEHYWGYTKVSETRTLEYEVSHPKWKVYPVTSFDIAVDFGSIYGKHFHELTNSTPDSVMLAEGSSITVEHNKRL